MVLLSSIVCQATVFHLSVRAWPFRSTVLAELAPIVSLLVAGGPPKEQFCAADRVILVFIAKLRVAEFGLRQKTIPSEPIVSALPLIEISPAGANVLLMPRMVAP